MVEPGVPYLDNWHIRLICEELEAITRGQNTRLVINIPPRYSKSTLVSVLWPVWEWINNPAQKWLFASYAQSLATFHSGKRRDLLTSQWFVSRWGQLLREDANEKTFYKTTAQGQMFSTSVGGSATGLGGNRIVIDDPINPVEAHSELIRKSATAWMQQTMHTRLDDKRLGAIVLVMQRLHEEDPTALALSLGWKHVCLPCEYEQTKSSLDPRTVPCPGDPRTTPGELLWPEREGERELAVQKKSLGSVGYNGQYQQRPAPAEGGLFKRKSWRFYSDYALIPALDEVLMSVDCTFKDSVDTDFVAIHVWGRKGAAKYLLDHAHERMGIIETMACIERLSARWPTCYAKLVEDKANGSAVIEQLRSKVAGLIPVQPEGGKIARAHAAAPTVEAGDVYLPSKNIDAWIELFIEECAAFPNGAHDDNVDAMSQAFLRFNTAGSLWGAAAAAVDTSV